MVINIVVLLISMAIFVIFVANKDSNMRFTGLLLLFISILFYNTSTAQGIEFFHGTWKEALVEAQKDDKLVFVDAYAKWCGPCKKMAKNVFTKAEVGDFYNENFVNLKLDMEEMDGVTFGHEYPVSAYPTLLFLNAKGELVKKSVGGKQANDLIELGKSAILSYDKSADYAILYDEGNRDFDLMMNYVKELNKVKKPSLKISNEYINSKPDITAEQRAQFLYTAVTESDSRLFTEMVKSKDLIMKTVSAEDYNAKVKTLALKTVEKAVEYDYADLLKDAVSAYKSADAGDNKRFEQEANMHYNLLSGNYDEWKSQSEKYLKKYGKKDPSLYKAQLSALKQEFAHQKDYNDYACDVCKQMVKKEDTVGNYSSYIELLIGCKKYAEARKVTNEAIKKAKSREENISNFEKYLKYLDAI